METEAKIKERKNRELSKKADERQAFIDRIKQEVSKPFDNINRPVPLFKQLQSGK